VDEEAEAEEEPDDDALCSRKVVVGKLACNLVKSIGF
jgi:hypothetical protein